MTNKRTLSDVLHRLVSTGKTVQGFIIRIKTCLKADDKQKNAGVGMKVILIFLFMLAGMAGVNFGMDMLMGYEKRMALMNMLNPFWVITPFGYFLLTGLIAILFLKPVLHFALKKYKA